MVSAKQEGQNEKLVACSLTLESRDPVARTLSSVHVLLQVGEREAGASAHDAVTGLHPADQLAEVLHHLGPGATQLQQRAPLQARKAHARLPAPEVTLNNSGCHLASLVDQQLIVVGAVAATE